METYYYYDKESKMILVNNFQAWKYDNHETGDALWRAGIAYICYKDIRIKDGLLDAFRLRDDGKYQACRCNPRIHEDDVSRDQVIVALAAFKINRDIIDLHRIGLNLPYKLSKRFNMTPNMWMWIRGMCGSKLFDYLNQFYMLIEMAFSILIINTFVKAVLGVEEYTQNKLETMHKVYGEPYLQRSILNTKFKKFLNKIEFPGYALHLSMWMIYVSRDSWIKLLIHKLILFDADKNNLLAKLICGEEVTDYQIENYKHSEEWRWSQRMTELTRTRIVPKDKTNKLIMLDKDILKRLKTLNNK